MRELRSLSFSLSLAAYLPEPLHSAPLGPARPLHLAFSKTLPSSPHRRRRRRRSVSLSSLFYHSPPLFTFFYSFRTLLRSAPLSLSLGLSPSPRPACIDAATSSSLFGNNAMSHRESLSVARDQPSERGVDPCHKKEREWAEWIKNTRQPSQLFDSYKNPYFNYYSPLRNAVFMTLTSAFSPTYYFYCTSSNCYKFTVCRELKHKPRLRLCTRRVDRFFTYYLPYIIYYSGFSLIIICISFRGTTLKYQELYLQKK